MALVTAAQVKVLTPSDILDADVLATFIAAADLIVTEDLQPLGKLSTQRLTMIELYLAAHFTALVEKGSRILRETTIGGDDRNTYEYSSKIDLGLKLTQFGQMAIMLDSTGTLATMADRKGQAMLSVASRRVLDSRWWPLRLPPWPQGSF